MIRKIATGVAGLVAFWLTGMVLSIFHPPTWLSWSLSAVVAVLAGRYVWVHFEAGAGLFKAIAIGALVVGFIGFCAGFFGPIIFKPDANQGPLLGIFVTGPLGFLLGGIGGGIFWFMRRKRNEVARSAQIGERTK